MLQVASVEMAQQQLVCANASRVLQFPGATFLSILWKLVYMTSVFLMYHRQLNVWTRHPASFFVYTSCHTSLTRASMGFVGEWCSTSSPPRLPTAIHLSHPIGVAWHGMARHGMACCNIEQHSIFQGAIYKQLWAGLVLLNPSGTLIEPQLLLVSCPLLNMCHRPRTE